MKKTRRVPVEAPLPFPAPPPPPVPSYPVVVGEDARARFRLQSLTQDYEELMKETAAKRKKLQREKQKISKLTAEVKFLRRRYQHLIKNPSPTPYQLKTHTQKTRHVVKRKPQNTHGRHTIQPQNRELGEPSQNGRSYREHEIAIPSTSAVLDLNQVSMPNGDEAEIQAEWEPPFQMEKSSKRYPLEADVAVASDLKLSICRDVGSGTRRSGKRKISWQDQVPLRV